MKRMQMGAALIEVNDGDVEFYRLVGFKVIGAEDPVSRETAEPAPKKAPVPGPAKVRKPRIRK